MSPIVGFVRGPAGDIASRLPVAWYRYRHGVAISQWDNNVSGNASPLLQATGANQPALQTDLSLLFDGVASFMRTATLSIAQPGTVYWLAKQVTWASSEKLFDGSGTRWLVQQRTGGASPELETFAGTAFGAVTALALDTYGVISAVYNGAASVLQVNNTTPTTGNAGANVLLGMTLCGDNAGVPTVFANFQVKDGIFYGAAHDAGTRLRVARASGRLGGVAV